MNLRSDEPFNVSNLAFLLKRYGKAKALSDGKRLHNLIRKWGYDHSTFLGNWIVQMYGNCGSLKDARDAFEKIANPNLYSWNILVNAYGQNGRLEDAKSVFKTMPLRDVVSWNAIVAALTQYGHGKEAVEFFQQMQLEGIRPTSVSFVCVLDACATLAALQEGQEIHAAIIGTGHGENVVMGNALINMYGKCGSLQDARTVFCRMPFRNIVSWTTLISAFTQNSQGKEALDLFIQMVLEGFKPDNITFGCALDACTSLAALVEGQELHAAAVRSGFEQDVMVGSALINLYAKCGNLNDARSMFCRISCQNVVSWTSMIAAYAISGQYMEALDLFHHMNAKDIKPDNVTFVCAVDACASLGALEEGQVIHAAIVDNGYEQDLAVGNALINMYGKCGSVYNAEIVFLRMRLWDSLSWNAMIAAFAHNGNGKEALNVFSQMQHAGIQPDDVTFVAVLTACSHTGLVDHASHFFDSMTRDHGLTHTIDHYVCAVDLYGRVGLLDEAEILIRKMPHEKAAVAWLCLLGACRVHGDVERGARAASKCFELDPTHAAPYIILSNMYAIAGRPDDVAMVRKTLAKGRVKEQHAFSCIKI